MKTTNIRERKVTNMSKTKYPSVTKDFGPPVSNELPPEYPKPYDTSNEMLKKEEPIMSNATKLSRTDILANALASASPRPSRATHIKLLSEDEWRMLHAARQNGSKVGLQQLFISMQRSYQDNDEAFFKDYAQFYNNYRQAVLLFGMAPIRVKKA